MLLLVGLGNPGRRHARHRHNIGFLAVDEIVRRHGFGPWRRRFQGEIAEGRVGRSRVLAFKPATYMNESGCAVGEALRFFKLETRQIVAFYDDLDLRPGKVRVKLGGGHGGHNGLRSIDSHIGADYWRVRLGIGHPGHKDLVQGYVLHDFAKAEEPGRDRLLAAVAAELPALVAGDEGGFMSRIAHTMSPPRPKPPRPASPAKGDSAEAGSAETEGAGEAEADERDGL